jgi:hypothetical protein
VPLAITARVAALDRVVALLQVRLAAAVAARLAVVVSVVVVLVDV